ncbi:hypothetical protein MRX96_032184 [Rhipicephalus microplus]
MDARSLVPGLGNDPPPEDVVPGSHAFETRLIAAAIGPIVRRVWSLSTPLPVSRAWNVQCEDALVLSARCCSPRGGDAAPPACRFCGSPALPAARATCGGRIYARFRSTEVDAARLLRGRMQSPNPGCSTGSPPPYDAHSMH